MARDFAEENRKAEDEIISNPKSFWKFVNKKKDHLSPSEYMKYENEVALNKKEAVNLFARYFGSVYTEKDDSSELNIAMNQSINEQWCNHEIPMHVIHHKLSTLDANKASGPDNLPPIFFKRCATSLTFPLYKLFNSSIRSGYMPKLWKLAYVDNTNS